MKTTDEQYEAALRRNRDDIHRLVAEKNETDKVVRNLQSENEQIKKACRDALETLEAFSRANSWGERLILEPSIARLKALRNEHTS